MAQSWWAADLWQGFKWSRQNTTAHSGVDKGMPCGTPVVTPVSGTVLNSGPQRWGGQVDILTKPGELPPPYDQNSPHVLSFLHLSREDVKSGQVQAGQQIGLSGQPPPGQGFGSGCHLHFEVTHGDTAPYTGYSPWVPTQTNYPVDGQPLINFVSLNGPASSGSLAWQTQPLAYTGTPQSAAGVPGWLTALSNIPVVGGALAQFVTSVPGLLWVIEFASEPAAPIRLFKLLAGGALILFAVWTAFRPELAAGITALAGAPEAAPAVYAAAGGGRNRFSGIGKAQTTEQKLYQQQKQAQKQAAAQNLANAAPKVAAREGQARAAKQPVRSQAETLTTRPAAAPGVGAQRGTGLGPGDYAQLWQWGQRRSNRDLTPNIPRPHLSQTRDQERATRESNERVRRTAQTLLQQRRAGGNTAGQAKKAREALGKMPATGEAFKDILGSEQGYRSAGSGEEGEPKKP